MEDSKQLISENTQLKQELEILKGKLQHVQKWMEREIQQQVHVIAKQKTKNLTSKVKNEFLKENFEEVIAKQINDYFGELLLLNSPKGTIEGIISAEISWYNMKQNPIIDGFSVISAYHKVLDLFVEGFITNNFRKFAKKKGQIYLRTNDPLEKSLNSIVNARYILSVGRLYGLMRLIKEDGQLHDYGKCFKEYLEKYRDIGSLLLDDDFYEKFTLLNRSEVLSSKRHSGTISKEDTLQARSLLIGDFKDTHAIIYRMLESQSVMY